jgi:hypothetical protein
MTVKQLKEELAKHPDHLDVFVTERKTEFGYGLINSAYVKKIGFVESPCDEVEAVDDVLILDEE